MLNLKVKKREEKGKQVEKLRKAGLLPAVLYGPKIKENIILKVPLKDFEKVYGNVGHSSLISLNVEGEKKEYLALIREVARDPVSGKIIHVDFYQPDLEKKVEAKVPLVLKGEAPAVKELGGTLIQNIFELEVRALPQSLPKEISADVSLLKTFEDSLLIKDLSVPQGVEILKNPEETIARVAPAMKVEEELAKPIEERVEEVEKVGERKKEEEGEEAVEKAEEHKKETSETEKKSEK